mmetsp:Transcript_29730/g.41724  ORF Transcript_29730/g.41724 Transcript_29730/m.41724 type:complete len:151 (-) Transcript_29730:64-516(-)
MSFVGDGIRRSLDEAQTKMNREVNKTIEDFELMLRPVLKKSFQCQIQCCDNTELKAERFEHCIQGCLTSVQSVHQSLNYEAKSMQDRYMRCNQACEDEMKDLMQVYRNSDGSPNMPMIEPKIVACVEKCTSSHIELLPVMMERLRTSIPK